jgi:hypothetical protein
MASKWEDTVMSKGKIDSAIVEDATERGTKYSVKYFTENRKEFKAVAEAQAEITWPIAFEEGRRANE